MATIEKRGQFWRVKVRRAGLPAQTKTFDNRMHAQQWARSVESDLDKGIVVDRRTAQRLSRSPKSWSGTGARRANRSRSRMHRLRSASN